MTGLGATANSSQAIIKLRSYLNPQGPTQQSMLNYQSDDGLTADAGAQNTVSIPASSNNNAINLATMFPACTAPIFVFVSEITNPGAGFKIGTASGAGKVGIGKNGFFAYIGDAATALPTLYVDNASASAILLTVGVMTQ